MKRIFALLCVFLLCTAFQCDDEPLEGNFITDSQSTCVQAQINTAEAALDFLGAQEANFTEICVAYKNAIEAQIIACGDEDGSLQSIIEELGDCTNSVEDDTACEDAILAKNDAEATFNASTDVNYTETCNALKIAIQAVIDECGSTAELESQLQNLGNCILTTGETGSGQITVTAGTLDITFDEIIIDTVDGVYRVSGETSASNNYSIYFEVPADETGTDSINSEFRITLTSTFRASTDSMSPFTSEITLNENNSVQGTFSGLVRNDNNADLNLTSGVIDIAY